jgi:hypothetical protein
MPLMTTIWRRWRLLPVRIRVLSLLPLVLVVVGIVLQATAHPRVVGAVIFLVGTLGSVVLTLRSQQWKRGLRT